LIDSALAGLQIMLSQASPAAPQAQDGFFAQWQGMPDAFMGISKRGEG
jgi:hypothetical protein